MSEQLTQQVQQPSKRELFIKVGQAAAAVAAEKAVQVTRQIIIPVAVGTGFILETINTRNAAADCVPSTLSGPGIKLECPSDWFVGDYSLKALWAKPGQKTSFIAGINNRLTRSWEFYVENARKRFSNETVDAYEAYLRSIQHKEPTVHYWRTLNENSDGRAFLITHPSQIPNGSEPQTMRLEAPNAGDHVFKIVRGNERFEELASSAIVLLDRISTANNAALANGECPVIERWDERIRTCPNPADVVETRLFVVRFDTEGKEQPRPYASPFVI